MPQYLNGLYLALLEGRFLFDFLHELQLTPQATGAIRGGPAPERRAG